MAADGLTGPQIIEGFIFGEYEFAEAGRCYRRLLIERRTVETDCGIGAPRDPTPWVLDAPPKTDAVPLGADADVAVYAEVIPQDILAHAASRVELRVSEEGTVSGSLMLREELENHLANVDLGCGLIDDEDCSGAVQTCPAVVLWTADLSSLRFSVERPHDGVVEGAVTVQIETTPDGCGEPTTESQELALSGTVSPEGAELTSPFAITLERQAEPS